MAVEAVGAVVLHNLTDLLRGDSIAFDNVIDQIEEIRIQLRRMRGFLIDAELSSDSGAVAWAAKYLDVLFSAEDEIENYVLSLSARGRRYIGFFQRHGFTLFAAVYDSCGPAKSLRLELDSLAVQIGDLEGERPEQVVNASLRAGNPKSNQQDPIFSASSSAIRKSQSDNLANLVSPKDGKRFEFMNSFPPIRRPDFCSRSHNTHPNITIDFQGPSLIGFNDNRKLLVDRLKEITQGGVIPIIGLPGSGKTTLVRAIYDLKEIKTHFKCRAWVHIPDASMKIPQILDSLLQQLLESKESGNRTAEQLTSQVKDSLKALESKDKHYLVVLDHVGDARCWTKLKSAFPNLVSGVNKVILITRRLNVAHSISEQEKCKPLPLSELCDEHSWELLIKEARLGEDFGFSGKILEKCKGRPLDIVLLGGLLSTKGWSCNEWESYLSQFNWLKMNIKTLSYNDLPAHLKICLLYMALFPNEMEISVRRLHRLWLAEGFVRKSLGMSEEDSVQECFNDLVKRNLIKISKFRSDGSPRRCCLPRALREYLSSKASEISLFYIYQEVQDHHHDRQEVRDHQEPVSIARRRRRVIEYPDSPVDSPASSSFSQNVRSYLSFNFKSNDTPATEVGNFISKIIGNKGYGVLRVLDLEGVYKPTLTETLKLLFHLRYLGLRWTFIEHLPESIGELSYLETLDLKRTYINTLPDSIWKLAHLRHLNLPGIRLDYKQKKGQSSLSELRTLEGMIVDDETTVEAELKKLHELRELGITCRLKDSKDLTRLIQKMFNLRSLRLKSKDETGRPSKIDLLPLSELSQLSHVSLLGHLHQLPDSKVFPPSLKVLALSVSRLENDPMVVLSTLPNLSVLRLLADSYLGTKMECPRDGFQNLRVLKLWMLKKLEKWTVGEGGMPRLNELNIRYCTELKQLPSQLLKTLKELTLTSMPEGFVQQVKQEKRSHTVLTENNYTFTSLPWEKDPELWKEAKADDNLDEAAS